MQDLIDAWDDKFSFGQYQDKYYLLIKVSNNKLYKSAIDKKFAMEVINYLNLYCIASTIYTQGKTYVNLTYIKKLLKTLKKLKEMKASEIKVINDEISSLEEAISR